jgi:hypothetical protein
MKKITGPLQQNLLLDGFLSPVYQGFTALINSCVIDTFIPKGRLIAPFLLSA